MWVKPHFTKVHQLSIPGGKMLRVKSGTQIIDRCWRHLREHIKKFTAYPREQHPHAQDSQCTVGVLAEGQELVDNDRGRC